MQTCKYLLMNAQRDSWFRVEVLISTRSPSNLGAVVRPYKDGFIREHKPG